MKKKIFSVWNIKNSLKNGHTSYTENLGYLMKNLVAFEVNMGLRLAHQAPPNKLLAVNAGHTTYYN